LTRAVSILEVLRPSVWDELAAMAPIESHLGESLGPLRRVALPSFEKEIAPLLARGGAPVLMRWARRQRPILATDRSEIEARIAGLTHEVRSVLFAAQRHALGDVIIGRRVWDPESQARAVDALHSSGLIEALPSDAQPRFGRYHLHPLLPPPPAFPYDFGEAVMPLTDDLPPVGPGPVALLHDLASLAAALAHHKPRRTHAGTLDKATGRKLGKRLGSASLASSGNFAREARWSRALNALELLGVVTTESFTRQLGLDPLLEVTLEGSARDALGGIVDRLVDRDLHAVLPAVAAALTGAGEGAVDEMIFLEELADQHRDVLFAPWHRDGVAVYPLVSGEAVRVFDADSFEDVEARMVLEVLATLDRLGLIRRAPGVFAATPDGLLWAAGTAPPSPPVWITSDLEIVVPPNAVTPWERFQLERLGRCLARDVVDRYRLDRPGLVEWLSTHELEEAVALLRRRCPAVPATVLDTLEAWGQAAMRVVLVRGVILGDEAIGPDPGEAIARN